MAQSHDDNGNLLSKSSGDDLMWDAFTRLCAIRDQGGDPRIFYIYDATNRRVRKEGEVENETEFYYSGWRVLEERETAGDDPVRQYVWGNYLDEALVMDVNGDNDEFCTSFTLQQNPDSRYFYLQNTLYSVYALTDQSAAVIEAYEYDPYGRHTLLTDGDYDGEVNFDETDDRVSLGESLLDSPITFTGQRFDPESSLHYFKRRLYGCAQGSFITRDPYEDPIYFNALHLLTRLSESKDGFSKEHTLYKYKALYQYASSKPQSFIDPDGERMWSILSGSASWGGAGLIVSSISVNFNARLIPKCIDYKCSYVASIVGLVANLTGPSVTGVGGNIQEGATPVPDNPKGLYDGTGWSVSTLLIISQTKISVTSSSHGATMELSMTSAGLSIGIPFEKFAVTNGYLYCW